MPYSKISGTCAANSLAALARACLLGVAVAGVLAIAPASGQGAVAGPQSAQVAAQDAVGVSEISINASHRQVPLSVHLWYPALDGGTATLVGDNALFAGVRARRDAPAAQGLHPLVLLSHGSGGNAANLSWIATRLAANGFIVAAPNHPGSTSGDSRQADTIKVWNRPLDLTAVLDGLAADLLWKARIDTSAISALGFSLGGHTVLASAGAQVAAAAYARYCDTPQAPGLIVSDCAWFARAGIDLHKIDEARFNASYRDPRIASVLAVDPALAQAFDRPSLAAMNLPVTIINLGQPGAIPPAVAARHVADAIQGASYRTVPDAIHFSFLGTCKPNGKDILKAEGETDPLCEDGGGRSREAIHEELARMILLALRPSRS